MPRMEKTNQDLLDEMDQVRQESPRSSGPVGRTAVSVAKQIKRTVTAMRNTD